LGQFDPREAVARKYRDQVDFLFIYTREAHPDSGMASTQIVDEDGQGLTQTETWEERANRAKEFARWKHVQRRILVDEDGERSVEAMYWGNRYNPAIVIGRDGRIAGKFEFADDARAVDQFLAGYLEAEAALAHCRLVPGNQAISHE
jgi:hypothetical protein